jgi:beta-1,4-mannosyltransferase
LPISPFILSLDDLIPIATKFMMKLYMHGREKQVMTELLAGEFPRVGLPCQFVENLADIPASTIEKNILLINWPHLFYHSPMEQPRRLPSLRRWMGWRYRLWQLRRRGVDVVWLLHNVMPHCSGIESMDRGIRRYLMQKCAGIVAFCADSLSELKKITGRRVRKSAVVPYPPHRLPPWTAIDRNAARESLGIKPEQRVVLNFGKWRNYKCLDELIEAFRQLQGDELRLVIMGEATLEVSEQRLQEICHDDVRIRLIAGRYSDEQMTQWLAAADWVVLPYRRVTNSGTAMTALNYGCPVIAPRLGCLPAMIPPGAGVFYDVGGLLPALWEAIALGTDELNGMRKAAQETYRGEDITRTVEAIKSALEGFM